MAKRENFKPDDLSTEPAPPQMAVASSIPDYIDVSADASHLGKTTIARRLRHYMHGAGRQTIMVRIESRAIDPKLEPGDVFIPVENFSRAGDLAGGIVGVLTPFFDAIVRARDEGKTLIMDWPAGAARQRLEAMAATRFDERMAALGMTGLSLVVTTNASDRMAEAAENLNLLAQVAPGLQRGVVLNSRAGDFNFASGSEQARLLRTLLNLPDLAAILKIPLLRGGCWKLCEEAGYTIMPEAMLTSPSDLAKRLKVNEFLAASVITEIEAWWQLTEKALAQVARFPEDAPHQVVAADGANS